MDTEPQSTTYNQPNWQVGTVYQTVQYITQPAERPPLWIDVPALPTHFVGRDAIVSELAARLTAHGSVALCAEGKPGVGKTTLAVALAYQPQVLAHFSDGVLWAGLGTQPDLPGRLARWANALGVEVSDLPTSAARAQAVRDAIGQRRLLLVIDDAWQWEAAELLRCGGPHCAHLLTSRDQRLARRFGSVATVEVLQPEAARQLLRSLAAKAVAADPAQADVLLAAVGYLPLAIELLGGYLAAGASSRFAEQSRQALTDLSDPARRLQLASRRLGDGSGQPVSLAATIALSLDGVAEESKTAVPVFHSLGAFAPKPARFDLAAAQAVAACDAETLALLADRNLLEIALDESLALHQTIADVARTGTPADAIARHRAHYLERVNADRQDWQSIEVIYPQIQWAWRRLVEIEPDNAQLLDFIWALQVYQERRGLWQDQIDWVQRGLEVARSHALDSDVAALLNNIGRVYNALGEKQQALETYAQALPLFRQVGDKFGEAAALTNIGTVYAALGEKQQALDHYAQALPLIRQVGDKSAEAATLNGIGGVYAALGDMQQALETFAQALPLIRQVGDKAGEAATLNGIGFVYSDLGDMQQALACYAQALPLIRQVGDKSGEAAILNNIGAVYSVLGDMQQALAYYVRALPLLRQVGDKSGEAATLGNIGGVYSALGEKQQALDYYDQALPLQRQVGDKSGEAITLNNIGRVYDDLGEKQQALAYYARALPLIRQVGDKSGEATTLNNIGLVYFALMEKQQALDYFDQALPLRRQVGDKSGEAVTLSNIGAVYAALGEKQQALAYYAQALPLSRQVGDRWGEKVTRHNMAMVYKALGRLDAAEEELQIVVQIDEAVGHPDLASDRQSLEQVRAMRRGEE